MHTQAIDISGLRRKQEQKSLFDEDAGSAVLGLGEVLAGRSVAVTDDVREMLASGAVAACSISGGKDGSAMALAVARYLDQIGHTGPRILIHADLGRVEWRDSLPACERLAKKLGWELLVVRRTAGDMLARWEGRWAANVARYEALETVKLILPWSTPTWRFCTSELKGAVLSRALKKRFPNHNILNIVGVRREESATRRKMPVSAVHGPLTRKGLKGLTWNAVIEWPLRDVWDEIHESGLVPHEAYTTYQTTRVSCVYCIMGSEHDLIAATTCAENHDVYRSMVALEAESTFAFQGARWLADVAPALLGDELAARVERAKQLAVVRQQAEAELPAHLLFEKGVPTGVPSSEEAELVASVRRRVNEAVGLQAQFLTGESVRDRYADLLRREHGGDDASEDGELELVPAATDYGC